MHIRRNINLLIQRSNYQIVKVYDKDTPVCLPPEAFLEDQVLQQRISPGRKHAWLIAAPKSGSTWLSALLEKLLGWRVLMLSGGMGGRREQEPDFRQILRFPSENIFSRHQHCRASESTVDFINRFRIKPIIQVRNIFDTIISFRDHCLREDCRFPMAYIDREFLGFGEEKQYQFIIEMVLPWYFNFYASWFQAECLAAGPPLFVQYGDLLQDPRATLRKILDYLGESRPPAAIELTLEQVKGMDTRKNQAVAGRGNCLLNERQKARIREMRQFYPHIDFSSIGL